MKKEVKTIKAAVKIVLFMCLATIPILISCAGTEPTAFEQDAIIIEANIFAMEPVKDIRLLYLQPRIYDSVVTRMQNPWTNKMVDTVLYKIDQKWIEDANVTISHNGESYPLTHIDSGYYAEPTGMLIPETGKTYRLDVYDTEGRHAWSETTVPLPATGFELSSDTLFIDTTAVVSSGSGFSGSGSGSGSGSFPSTVTPTSSLPDSLQKLTVKWDNPDYNYMFFRFEHESGTNPYYARYNVTNTPGIIIRSVHVVSGSGTGSGSGSGGRSGSGKIRFSGGSGSGSGLDPNYLRTFQLTEFGRYKMFLYTSPPADEYWEALVVRADTSHKILDRWTRSPTNIKGGVGYFASFGVDSISFTVAMWKEEEL